MYEGLFIYIRDLPAFLFEVKVQCQVFFRLEKLALPVVVIHPSSSLCGHFVFPNLLLFCPTCCRHVHQQRSRVTGIFQAAQNRGKQKAVTKVIKKCEKTHLIKEPVSAAAPEMMKHFPSS